MNRTAKIPQLRFPGFTGEWEEKKLGDVADIIDGDRGLNYPKQDDFSNDGYCLFLSAKNVTKGGFVFDEKQFISERKDNQLRKGKLQRDDIVLTTRGTVGNFAHFNDSVSFENIRLNSGMVIIRNLAENGTEYYFKYFYSPYFNRQVKTILFGSAQPQLTIKEIRKFKIALPTLPEQEKIADFLSDVDTKIEKLSRKKDLMSEYKKGVMQKVFSQEIRFKDEDDNDYPDWVEKKLGDVSKYYDGTHMTPKYTKTGIPFYSVENVTGSNFTDTKFIAEDVYIKECKRVKIEKGDILMTRIGDIGTSKLVDWDVKASFYVSLALIKQSDKYNSRFLNQYISTNNFQRELHKRTIHVAFPKKINLGEIGNCMIEFPCLEEQKKIAEFLTNLDKKIENIDTELNAVKEFKKGLLQGMFV